MRKKQSTESDDAKTPRGGSAPDRFKAFRELVVFCKEQGVATFSVDGMTVQFAPPPPAPRAASRLPTEHEKQIEWNKTMYHSS